MIIKLHEREVNTMLTPKQEKFVQELIKGKSQREAYREAYNLKTMKDENIDSKASKLFAEVKVRSRYDELIGKGAEKALWTREQAINDLMTIKNEALAHLKREIASDNGEPIVFIDNKMAKVATDSIKELNNMHGFNEQNVKVDAETEVEVTITVVDKVKK